VEALTEAGPLAVLVAGSLVLGAIAAATVKVPSRLAALVTAGGGGLLLAAVAFELVPEAGEQAGPLLTVAGLLAGAVLYVAADAALARHEGMTQSRQAARESAVGMPVSAATMARASVARGEAIAAGIVVDGIPESLALGLMAVEGASGPALLVAVVVGNLTESYGAAQPIIHGGRSRRFAVGLLAAIGLGLGATTMLGGLAGGALPGSVIGTAQAVAGGAVVAVLSISILPYAFDEADRKVALATVAGLAAGYLLSV
jgi:zinc transporter, ZIP family